mmetsp:Transcript_5611/g.17252  ORF Transcript_5611/g.17252 Transcript_5611/m.17252 type:complete len:215 (+) Transcript_5611:296-940(+)
MEDEARGREVRSQLGDNSKDRLMGGRGTALRLLGSCRGVSAALRHQPHEHVKDRRVELKQRLPTACCRRGGAKQPLVVGAECLVGTPPQPHADSCGGPRQQQRMRIKAGGYPEGGCRVDVSMAALEGLPHSQPLFIRQLPVKVDDERLVFPVEGIQEPTYSAKAYLRARGSLKGQGLQEDRCHKVLHEVIVTSQHLRGHPSLAEAHSTSQCWLL